MTFFAPKLQQTVSALASKAANSVGDGFKIPEMPFTVPSISALAQKVQKGNYPLLDLDLRRLTGQQSIGPSSPVGIGLVIGDVRVLLPMQQGGYEEIQKEVEPARHPQEDRRKITDHTWRNPFVFSISGSFVDDPLGRGAHRLALDKLHEYQEKAEIVPLFIDFKGLVTDCIVRSVTAQRADFQNTYKVSIVVEQVYFTSSPVAGENLNALSQMDPSTGTRPEGMTDHLGLKDMKKWGLPSPRPQGDHGNQPGDGGIGGFFGKMLNVIKNLADAPLGKMAVNALKDTVGKTPLGQLGLAAFDVLTGNQSSTLTKALKVGMDFLKGKADLLDIANVALDVLPGGSQIRDAIIGPAAKALGFIEGLPGGKSILAAGEKFGFQYAGGFLEQIGEKFPHFSGMTGIVSSWLKEAK